MDIDTGITDEVFTVKSDMKIFDIINPIIGAKSEACLDYLESLDLDADCRIVVVGSYLTGVGIVKWLSDYYNNILLIDIYSHLKDLIDTDFAGKVNCTVEFSSDIDLIYSGDVVIDTTGFGGLSVEQTEKLDVKAFLIEDPVAEDNDVMLKNKNNIHERLDAVDCENKAVLKTSGLDSKTSGTMTLTIKVLMNALNECLKIDGVLYSACEMTFFEEVIFKQKDVVKFMELVNKPALKVSTIKPFSCNEILLDEIIKIKSETIK